MLSNSLGLNPLGQLLDGQLWALRSTCLYGQLGVFEANFPRFRPAFWCVASFFGQLGLYGQLLGVTFGVLGLGLG